MTDRPRRGAGRPPASDADAGSTRDRLIDAAIELAVEVGVDRVTLSGVARRAGYTTPAIYTHFDSRTALLVEALRRKLDDLELDLGVDPADRIVEWMLDADPTARRFLADLHVSALRDEELARVLHEFQASSSASFVDRGDLDRDRFAALSVLVLGASLVDSLDSLGADRARVADAVRRMVGSLFES